VDNATSHVLAASGLPISEFDGEANIWANSVEDLMAVSSLFLSILIISFFMKPLNSLQSCELEGVTQNKGDKTRKKMEKEMKGYETANVMK
jgi:hypothetical protein